MVITHGKEVGDVGRCRSKGIKLQLRRMTKFSDIMYSMMTIADNTILNT